MKNLVFVFFVFVSQVLFSQLNNVAIQLEFVKVLNTYRIENGLNPVKVNVDIQEAAKIQSDYIASTYYNYKDSCLRGKSGHFHPNYPNPSDRLRFVNSKLEGVSLVSENMLFFSGGCLKSQTVEEYVKVTFNSWKNSPGHNKIMLNPSIEYIGLSLSTKQVKVNVVTFDVYIAVLNLVSSII
jgi:uncharacterized protein YkwD